MPAVPAALLQAEGDAEQHRHIGPWQALLGEPDWKRVDALGELGVAQLLEGRPGQAATTVSLEERTEVRIGCGVRGVLELLPHGAVRLRCAGVVGPCSRGCTTEAAVPPMHPAATQDLRTRVLCITLGAYEEMFDAQFLSPPVYNGLKVR